MISTQNHRTKHQLNIPNECNGFKIDDYIEYIKDGKIYKDYIYCFRPFGYNWFAWIYFDKNIINPVESVYVGELKKIEE